MPTLILTPRFTDDAQALWRAANRLGWQIERLTSWRVPEELRAIAQPVLYLEGLLGPTLAAQFGQRLIEPTVDWLPHLPLEYLKRRIILSTLYEAQQLTDPAFIKPPNDKSFGARVYRGSELPTEFPPEMPVLVAEPVEWEVEFRCFVLERRLRTFSVYLRGGELQRESGFQHSEQEEAELLSFVDAVLADSRVPLSTAAVIDVGTIAGRGWAVVEQNAAWGSGIYGCNPAEVLEVLRHASLPA